MAQVKTFGWTNAGTAVARDQDVGFVVAEVSTYDTTNGGSWYWTSNMADAAVLDVDSGSFGTTNGFTPLAESVNYGAVISGFTNANPGVITVDDSGPAGFAAGDTIQVAAVADDGASSTLGLNRSTYTIASLTATTLTLDQNTSSDNVYVSGGFATRISDTNGDAIPIENFARLGITVGTTPVGANNAVMVAIVKGENSVV